MIIKIKNAIARKLRKFNEKMLSIYLTSQLEAIFRSRYRPSTVTQHNIKVAAADRSRDREG